MENKFVPQIAKVCDRTYVVMMLEAKVCPICSKVMIRQGRALMHGGHFPNAFTLNLESQMKDAGLVFLSCVKVDDESICVECVATGKADFLCALCNKRYPTDQEQYCIGDAPEYLCKSCYASVPAKVWDEKVEQLMEEHRYDYE
jgi:hypothetical protein